MSIMKNINYISKMNVMGCSSPDFFVLIETGFEAAAPALLQLFTPGCTDIVKMKLGLPHFHSRTLKGLLKGAAAPFAKDAKSFLYKIGYFTAERGLYYFMLADVAVEFVTTWQSLAFAAEQCPLPSAGTAYGYIAPFVYNPNTSLALVPTPVHNVPGMGVGLHGFTIFPGFQGSVAFSCQWDSWPVRGEGVSVNTWIEEINGPEIISLSRTNQPPSQPHNETASHLSFDTLHNLSRRDYILHVENNGDNRAQPVSSTYSIAMSGHNQGVLPWGCHPKKTSVPFL